MLNYDDTIEKLKIIGVTGTNGKTTTAKLLCHILDEEGVRVGFINSEEISIANRIISRGETKDLYQHLHNMAQKGIEIIVVEINDQSFSIESLEKMRFDAIVHTNIEISHIREEEAKKYIAFQQRIFSRLTENGIGIINIDDKNNIKLLENIGNRLMITYGLCTRATITASSIDIAPTIKFNCCIQRGITNCNEIEIDPMEFPVYIHLLGRHNVYNALAAVTASLMYGVLPENVGKYIKSFEGLKRRMYLVYDQEYKIIDDMSHNPPSYEAALETIQGVDYERLYIVNAIMGNRGVTVNRYNSLALCNWIKAMKYAKIVITSSQDSVKEIDQVLEKEKEIVHQTLKENNLTYEYKDKLREAIQLTLSEVGKNDLVLLLGQRGMDEGENIIKQLL
ncbi:Mur ligase family protein [Clostridiaceae bacterium 35-E11]